MNSKEEKRINGRLIRQAKKIIHYENEENTHKKTLFLGEWNVFILVANIKVK